jgi:hypothetical protein
METGLWCMHGDAPRTFIRCCRSWEGKQEGAGAETATTHTHRTTHIHKCCLPLAARRRARTYESA